MAVSGATQDLLTVDDLGEVHEQMLSASSQWYNIGTALKVKTSRLENIKSEYHSEEDRLREVIKEWLKTGCSPLTWESVTATLRKQTIRQNSLANRIEKQYCQEDSISSYQAEAEASGFTTSSMEEAAISSTQSTASETGDDQPKSKLSFGNQGSPFPYLRLGKMSYAEKIQLEGTLRDAYELIDRRFATFSVEICDSLVKREVQPSRVAEVLRTLRAFTTFQKGSEKPTLHDCYEDIKKANTVSAIFDIIRDFVSFFSIGLIEHIIDHLGSDEDRARLQQYKEYLDEYCKRSVFECPCFSKQKEGTSELVVKIDQDLADTYSMRKLKILEVQIAKIIELSESALKLCKVQPGCMELHYQMPRFLRDLIFPLSEDTKASLRRIGVIHLTCDNDQYLTTSPAMGRAEPGSNQRPIPPQATKKIFERPRGGERTRQDSKKECSAHKLTDNCEFGPRCKFKHGNVLRRPSKGALPYPVRLPWRLVIGRCGNDPNRAYITQISEENPDKEVIVIAENDEALEEAKKDLTILFAQLFPMRPGWTFIHNDGIVTPDLQVMFQEITGRRLWFHEKRTAYEIVCRQKAGASRTATVEEIGRLHLSSLPQSESVERVLQTVDEEGKSIGNLRLDTTASARFRMMTDRKQIMEDLHKAFEWLNKPEIRKPEYTSKLEARFGKLAFSNLPKGLTARGVSISVKDFAEFMFKDTGYKQIFNTEVKSENALQLRHHLGQSFSMLETYDMKLMATNKGHLDVRITFEHGKPRVLQLKKDEHKVVVFDFLCLHRNHDMRLSLSRFEVLPTSPPDAIMSSFLSHICLTPQGNLRLLPHTDTWTVSFIRHKKREVFPLLSNSVVSISEIEECQIKKHDMELNQPLEMTNYNKKHFEVEFHNLAWISAFGREIGLTPRRSLSPLIEERAIRDLERSLPEVDRPTDMILEDFDKQGIFEMIEGLNEGLGGIAT